MKRLWNEEGDITRVESDVPFPTYAAFLTPLLNVPAQPTYLAPAGHSVDITAWPKLAIGVAGVIGVAGRGKG